MNKPEIMSAYIQLLKPVRELLQTCDLPFEDIDNHFQNYVVAIAGAKLTGVIGLEHYGKAGLLRSFAVHQDFRNTGIGNSLLEYLVTKCKEMALEKLYLLTTTAQGYFSKKGFEIIKRDNVPEIIKATKEFQNICPVSAICMVKTI